MARVAGSERNPIKTYRVHDAGIRLGAQNLAQRRYATNDEAAFLEGIERLNDP
jgi:hypothetical protein